MNQSEIIHQFMDTCPRSCLTIDVFNIPVTFNQRATGRKKTKPITVSMYAVKGTSKADLVLQECTRDLAIENLIYRVTGQYIKAYDDMCARSVLMAGSFGGTCIFMSTKNKVVYEIVLPDRRLLSGMWYYLCIFELVFLTINDYSKIGHDKRYRNKMLVYATNCLMQLGMLDIDKEFYKQDHEKRKPDRYTGIYKLPLFKLKENHMHMVHWPKPVYRYYKRFKNALKQKYSSAPTVIGEHIKDFMTIKPEWCDKNITKEYTDLAASLVKLRYHTTQVVTEAYADVRPTCNNTSSELSDEMSLIFNMRRSFIVYTNPYQYIYSRIDYCYGRVYWYNATMEVFLSMGYRTSESARYNTVRNLLTLYHEIGHLLYVPAMSPKNLLVTSRALQDVGYNHISYETHADKFAVWCVIRNGYTIDDIIECYSDIKRSHSKKLMYRYARFISYLQKKGVNIAIPADIARMFL